MSQVTVRIGSETDQKRFDTVLTQMVDMAAASTAHNDAMISVRTERRIDHMVKTVICTKTAALTYFIDAYTEGLAHV